MSEPTEDSALLEEAAARRESMLTQAAAKYWAAQHAPTTLEGTPNTI